MRRGELWLVDLDPSRRDEADKIRPVLIIGNDGANISASRRGRGVITVAPLTTNTTRVYEFQVAVPAGTAGLDQDSKVQLEQIRSLSVSRFVRRIGVLPAELMREVDTALRLHLSLS